MNDKQAEDELSKLLDDIHGADRRTQGNGTYRPRMGCECGHAFGDHDVERCLVKGCECQSAHARAVPLDEKIVHLTRSPEDAMRTPFDSGVESWIKTHGPNGTVMPIAASYIGTLRAAGWRGLEQIPAECIVGEVDAPAQKNGQYPWKETTEGHIAEFHGYQVHITNDGEVWLNTEVSLFDGLCIGSTFGSDPREAVQDAIATLELALVRLRAFHP